MTQPPLTHHDILGLVAPFTRRGRQVDLAASDRMARRLVFKPVEHLAGALPALQETLALDHPGPQHFVLTRKLALACGTQATLQVSGAEPAELLAQIEAIDPARQLRTGPGYRVAFGHRLGAAGALLLVQAMARVEGLGLSLNVPAVKGYAAEVGLAADAADPIELPDDLLAVLGPPWSRLQRLGARWKGALRLKGNEPERSRHTESLWEQAAAHLARTLAEPPARFHERLAGARWRVAWRRSLPLLGGLCLIGAALAVPHLAIAQDSSFRMLIFNAPPLLLALGVCMKELPRFEFPRLPRRSKASAWRQAAPALPPSRFEPPTS